MGTTLRVLLLTQVQAGVAAGRRRHTMALVERGVRPDRSEPRLHQGQGLVAEGAAGVDAAHERALRVEPGQRLLDLAAKAVTQLGRGAVQGGQGGADATLERSSDRRRPVDDLVGAEADQGGHDRGGARRLDDGAGGRRRRWLGDEQDDVRGRVLGQGADGQRRHATTDRRRQVAPAHADHLCDALAPAVEQAHRLLRAGAGGGDDADAPGADDVGEPQPAPAQRRRPRAGAHDQVTDARRVLLQLDLVLQRHVVAEQQHVEPGAQRLVRLERGEGAGYGDDGDVGVRQLADGFGQIPRDRGRIPAGGRGCPLAEQGVVAGRQGPADGVVVRAPSGEDEVAGRGAVELDVGNPLLQERLHVGRCRHERRGPGDPFGVAHGPRRGQQQHGVDIGVDVAPDAAGRTRHRLRAGWPAGRILVPAPPAGLQGVAEIVARTRSGVVITAIRPPLRTKRAAAATLGPMLPAGNWPASRCRSASVTVMSRSGRSVGRPEVDRRGRDRRDQCQRVGAELGGQALGRQVLVDHGFDAAVARSREDDRDAAAAVGDDQHPGRHQGPDGVELEQAERLRRGHHPPVAPPRVLDHHPATLGEEACCGLPVDERADRLGRQRERRVVAVDDDVRAHAHDTRVVGAEALPQGQGEDAADLALRHGHEREQGLARDHVTSRLLLDREGSDLGSVAVDDDHAPARRRQVGDGRRHRPGVRALLAVGAVLARLDEGVPAEPHHYRSGHGSISLGPRTTL